MSEPESSEFSLVCPACGEETPPEYPTCWNCHADLPVDPTSQGPHQAHSVAQSRLPWLVLPEIDDVGSGEPVQRSPRQRILFELIVVVLVLCVPAIASGFFYVFNEAGDAANPEGVRMLSDELFALIWDVSTLSLIGYFAWLTGSWKSILGLRRCKPSREVLWSILVFGGLILSQIPSSILGMVGEQLLGVPDWERNDLEVLPRSLSWYALPLTTLLHAATEEIFFRAYLWRRLTQLLRRPFLAIVISSALFALVHAYDPAQTLNMFFFGAWLGVVYAKSRSIWRISLAHTAWNMIVYLS